MKRSVATISFNDNVSWALPEEAGRFPVLSPYRRHCFHINLKETFETNHFADSDKTFRLSADTDRNSRTFQFGIRHLASDRTFTDQFIQLLFLRRTPCLHITDISRANRFVCFLRPFALGMILANL